MSKQDWRQWRVASIGVGFPYAMLATIYFGDQLIDHGVIGRTSGYILLGVVVTLLFFVMIRLLNDGKDQ